MTTPLITDLPQLQQLADTLSRLPRFAIDLEADSLHSYKDKVCLLQISWGDETALIDPLALPHIDPLKPVLADPAITKIFHAADYDIRSLHRDFDIEIRGLFDTMIASQFCGAEKWGLADVLQQHFAITLDKTLQTADWSQRPLSPAMIQYAAEDTRHLAPLMDRLDARLRELGRRDWVAEEFTLLEQVRMPDTDGPLFLRFKGAGRLQRRQLAVLEALLQWRDAEARRRDCPLFKVLGNKIILELAQQQPRTEQALESIPGLPPRLANRYGRSLLTAVRQGCELPDAELPLFPKGPRREKDPEAETRFKQLKDWRQTAAVDLGLDPGVLINNATLEEVARCHPRTVAQLETVAMKAWQRRALGPGLLAALSGS